MNEKENRFERPADFISEELTAEELNEINELEDFVDSKVIYQVWLLGYDQEDLITDFSLCVFQSEDQDAAIEHAQRILTGEVSYLAECFEGYPENETITVEVETVVTDDEGNEENLETIFEKTIYTRH